ncbi:general secretion pathway protein GspB [Thiohalobacter sp.]|uniref:general secretion pathway protein GspB n=1 Tax=Thiohalobacter sp. TaxID=2025948 RepID=UPI00261DD1DB|nr:general secretion pathway protein GspB [Thiohalobacter sp.]
MTAAASPAPLQLRPLPPVPGAASSEGTIARAPSGTAPRQSETEAPAWSELPPEQRGRVTRPRIDVHVHAEDPVRRFVLIDLKRYREGDRLPSGARLERIEADGILLDDNGIRYRVPRP